MSSEYTYLYLARLPGHHRPRGPVSPVYEPGLGVDDDGPGVGHALVEQELLLRPVRQAGDVDGLHALQGEGNVF